jgi:hypothetical protein
MSGPQNSFVAAIGVGLENFARNEIEGCDAGVVSSFNKDTQTATIRRVVTRRGVEQASLPNVPVLFPPFMAADIPEGTPGLILTGALNWKLWWRTGEVGPPEDTAFHSAASAAFLPNLRPGGDPRSIETNSSHLVKPAGGTVRLGTYDASKFVVHEDLQPLLDAFLSALDTWGAAVGTATGVAWAPVQTALGNLKGADYLSTSVKVED